MYKWSKKYPLKKEIFSKLRVKNPSCIVYEISLKSGKFSYPKGKSPIIYYGSSEAGSRSVFERVKEHISSKNGNTTVVGYCRSGKKLQFRYTSYPKNVNIKNKEYYFILKFFYKYGCQPFGNEKKIMPVEFPALYTNQMEQRIASAIRGKKGNNGPKKRRSKKMHEKGRRTTKLTQLQKIIKQKPHLFPLSIYFLYKGQVQYRARVLSSGQIKILYPAMDKKESSLSRAAKTLKGNEIDGWIRWYYKSDNGNYYPMDNLRKKT